MIFNRLELPDREPIRSKIEPRLFEVTGAQE
jgi:hypothetical protein